MAIQTLRYRYRIYPDPVQQQLLARTFGCARVVFNDAVHARQLSHRARLPYPDMNSLKRAMAASKATPARAWLKDVGSTALQEAVIDADTAYKNFFASLRGQRKGRKVRAPRFKSRKDRRQCFRITGLNNFAVRTDSAGRPVVRLQKIGEIRMALHRTLPSTPSSVTIIQEADGRYYASFVTRTDTGPLPVIDRSAGIDLGLNHLASIAYSDGTVEKIENPRFLKKKLRKLATAQKELARRQKGSANQEKSRIKAAALHRKVRDTRADHHHKLARKIVDENQVIGLETLGITAMARTRLAKSVHDAGWGTLVRLIEEKAATAGRTVVKMARDFPSTRQCHHCHLVREKIPLHVRFWTCAGCGTVHDRDINAALNMLNVAEGQAPPRKGKVTETQNDCGGAARPRHHARARTSETVTTPGPAA